MNPIEDDDEIPPEPDGAFRALLTEDELAALLRGEGAAGLPPVNDSQAAVKPPRWFRRLWKR